MSKSEHRICEPKVSVLGVFLSGHLALDAAQVQQVEVAGQDGLERGEGLQRRDAASFGQDGQHQDLVVQEGVCHVTEYRREASCCTVHHLQGHRDRFVPQWYVTVSLSRCFAITALHEEWALITL